ncbi:MAG: ECF transporter S component [Clostridium sp.]|nr:ECF transporter S component [Clostridium sp.]
MQGKSVKRWVGYMVMLLVSILLLLVFWKLGNGRYYLFATLLIIGGMMPFIFGFERKKPQAAEMVLVSVMSAVAVASRMAFSFVPHFKPMAAIVMITGMAFGPTAGFISGMLSAFVSDFTFGPGPWMPWQMFAFGMAGFIAGILYEKKIINENKRLVTALLGFLLIVLIVGPLLDTSTFFLMDGMLGDMTMWSIYLSGLSVNAVHGVAVAMTLLLLCKPFMERINRIKVKYDIS